MRSISRRVFLSSAAALAGLPALPQTAPANDFHFAIMGDRTGTPFPQIYTRVWREMSMFAPDFAVTIGDSIQGLNDATARREWEEMRALWDGQPKIRLYHVPGNHDIWNASSEKLYTEVTGHAAHYSFTHQNAAFIVLDNSRTEALAPGEIAFLNAELSRHRDRSPKFVWFHKPYWLAPVRLGIPDFELHRIMREQKVDYVVSGHGHQLVHLQREGVHYVEIGSSGGSIERGLKLGQGFRDGWFYHFLWVRVTGGKVSITVKELSAPWGQGRMFRLDDWVENGPKFDPGDPALIDRPKL